MSLPINQMGGGGGLNDAALALADATPDDVAAGKTFYAGDKELKTGTAQVSKVVCGRQALTLGNPSAAQTVEVGFRPKFVIAIAVPDKDGLQRGGHVRYAIYNNGTGLAYYTVYRDSGLGFYRYPDYTAVLNITDTGFTFNPMNSTDPYATRLDYLAVG